MFNSFPICRSIFDHWIYADADYLKIWVTMLGRARYLKDEKTGLYQKIQYTLKYGEFIFGRKQWSKDLGIGEQRIRTCIKKLEKDNMIKLEKSTSKFTIFSVTNYAKFNHQGNHQQDEQIQQLEETTNHQTNHQLTTIQPPSNHHLTTNKEGKERKEIVYTLDFEAWYRLYPNQFNKEQTFKNWKSTLKNESKENIVKATIEYLKQIKINKTELKYIIRSTNFIGQKQEYKGYLKETTKINTIITEVVEVPYEY